MTTPRFNHGVTVSGSNGRIYVVGGSQYDWEYQEDYAIDTVEEFTP
jgi:hypothetical protein